MRSPCMMLRRQLTDSGSHVRLRSVSVKLRVSGMSREAMRQSAHKSPESRWMNPTLPQGYPRPCRHECGHVLGAPQVRAESMGHPQSSQHSTRSAPCPPSNCGARAGHPSRFEASAPSESRCRTDANRAGGRPIPRAPCQDNLPILRSVASSSSRNAFNGK